MPRHSCCHPSAHEDTEESELGLSFRMAQDADERVPWGIGKVVQVSALSRLRSVEYRNREYWHMSHAALLTFVFS